MLILIAKLSYLESRADVKYMYLNIKSLTTWTICVRILKSFILFFKLKALTLQMLIAFVTFPVVS